jgi:hypothetical protein
VRLGEVKMMVSTAQSIASYRGRGDPLELSYPAGCSGRGSA